MKRLTFALLALFALVAAALIGGRIYIGRAEPDPERGAVLAGLSAPVEVWRDSLGVPHVWARSQADLFRAVGYVHAQDRLWQMELFRRVADGRMAEVLGPNLVETDRFLRTIGMGRAAGENEALLDGETRALLQAYADGVNAWMRNRPGPLPPEFLTLRFEPEPWTIRNSLSIAKIMAWDLADWNLGLDLQRATDAVGPELARELYPAYPDSGLDILGDDATWSTGAAPAPARAAPAAPIARLDVPRMPPLAAYLLDGVSAARASNSWIIGGSRTRSGKPIVANDMHLALRAPSLWYLGAIHAEGLNVTGMMLPGVPVVVAGHSDRVAWAYTNAMVDDVDFFVEQVDSADATRYRTPDGWASFEAQAETIRVKGADPVVHTVRRSRHGPILSDVEKRSGGRVLAMQWTAHEPSRELFALLGMNRARSADEFATALRDFRNPHQNVAFADVDGQFGYWMGGRVPVRRSGDGILPVAGWTGEGDWVRYLEFDEHPHVMNPRDGFIVTANNRQVGARYPWRIANDWADPFRAERIREMIEQGRAFTAADVARQQMDVRDRFAVRYLPYAVAAARLAGDSAAAALLRGWDGTASLDSRAATVFYLWIEALRKRVADDEFRGQPVYFRRSTLGRILEAGGSRWVDDVGTPQAETLDELSAAAMRQAVADAAGRPWGELHSTRIEHPLGVVAALDRALGLNIGPFPSPGAGNTVNVAGFGRDTPFVTTYGPSQRHVVDLGAIDDEGGFVIPTGQSGVPTSAHYRDQTALWREGRLWRIPLDRRKAEARVVARMTLRPR